MLLSLANHCYQVLCWQDADPGTRVCKWTRSSSTYNDVELIARGSLELELQDASEQPAALAVLQSLYAVKPLPELLSELSQEQQLQAAVLADKWQVPNISRAAAELLVKAANTPGALEDAVQDRLLETEALPDCLQPLLKSVLLSLLGDLEGVWADAGLRDKLLRLPLHAMELLLFCDELKVRWTGMIFRKHVSQTGTRRDGHNQHATCVLLLLPIKLQLVRRQHLRAGRLPLRRPISWQRKALDVSVECVCCHTV
jgi:hypothetical protein